MLARFLNVIDAAPGRSGYHLESGSSRLTRPLSTSTINSVDVYVKAKAPARMCMELVAGTPVIDSPSARS